MFSMLSVHLLREALVLFFHLLHTPKTFTHQVLWHFELPQLIIVLVKILNPNISVIVCHFLSSIFTQLYLLHVYSKCPMDLQTKTINFHTQMEWAFLATYTIQLQVKFAHFAILPAFKQPTPLVGPTCKNFAEPKQMSKQNQMGFWVVPLNQILSQS